MPFDPKSPFNMVQGARLRKPDFAPVYKKRRGWGLHSPPGGHGSYTATDVNTKVADLNNWV